jgi:transposase, IS30 family
MKYQQLNAEERFLIGAMRRQGLSRPQIAAMLSRDRTTVWRELRRNCAPYDGGYRSQRAHERAAARRKRSRRNRQFGQVALARVETLLKKKWSPQQISGHLGGTGELWISHETIYRHIWRDRHAGGTLHTHLRWSRKKRRKRYNSYDSRGRLDGKRRIGERPASVETRRHGGHWEIDTMMGKAQECVLTLVERKSGYVLIGKLRARTAQDATERTIELIGRHAGKFKTITADNGTEFHSYARIEAATGVKFYFATPHHAWERATNENTNGLIRQYLPKRQSMLRLTQDGCDYIAQELNHRPRKRHEYKTPNQCFNDN